jgi:hypothetical protein
VDVLEIQQGIMPMKATSALQNLTLTFENDEHSNF